MMLALPQIALAQEKTVTGTVTYIAAGAVYTSLGWESGVRDSCNLYIKSGSDTTAMLRAFACSSKSSVCRVVKSKQEVKVGAAVVASVVVEPPKAEVTKTTSDSQPLSGQLPGMSGKTKSQVSGPVQIQGRISAQYYVNRYDNELYNTTQPGIVLNLRARSTDIPLKFEVYSNMRSLAYGNESPFSKSALNQSRVYRLSLEYDDGANDISVGRIIPMSAPAIGYIDGALVARKLGIVTIGTTFGYQPSYTLHGVSTDYKKFALFASVQPVDSANLTISTAYARTYYLNILDREVLSGNVTMYTQGGFQVYGYSEVDMRSESRGAFKMSPTLTSLFVNANYRVTQLLTLGIGADASRPLYTFSVARFIPDSLQETRLRSGVSTTISLYLPGGVTLSNTYSPRTSEANFASVYSNYTTIGVSNVFSSGVYFRSNFNLNSNEYSTSNGYGLGLQRNIMNFADVNLRYQQNTYTLKNYDDRHLSRTMGTDVIFNLTRAMSMMVSYDRLDGYGIISNSIFGELSVRF